MIQPELELATVWMNAAGTLGFAPPARWPVEEPMAAFVTNPISRTPRTPARERALLPFPGGALLHSGLPNPGFRSVLRSYASRWAQSSLPVWVHLFGGDPAEIGEMVRQLESREGVMAIELELPPGTVSDTAGAETAGAVPAQAFIAAAAGELPVVVHVPLSSAEQPWLRDLAGMGASAICLGPPRGALPNATGNLVRGRLLGPACLPLMIEAVQTLKGTGLPVIAGAGVFRRQDARALRDAGAAAVQLDAVLWRGWVEDTE